MAEIETSIAERYDGTVPPKFNTALFLLADNLDLLAECRRCLREDGLFCDGKRNPILVSISNLTAALQSSLKSMGCTIHAEGLLKDKPTEDEEENFLENLNK